MKKTIYVFVCALLFIGIVISGKYKSSMLEKVKETEKNKVSQTKDTSEATKISKKSKTLKSAENKSNVAIVWLQPDKEESAEYAAKLIQETVGGNLLEVNMAEHTFIKELEGYDTIILGCPEWVEEVPESLSTFLEKYDFSEQMIVPFVIRGGVARSHIRTAISDLQPGAYVIDNILSLSCQNVSDSKEHVITWAKSLTLSQKESAPDTHHDTVATAKADSDKQQTLYLWERDNVPAVTEYAVNDGNYFDNPDFRPYIVTFPVPEGTKVKGAVLITAGGSFQFRSDQTEGTPVAEELSKLGYQSFVVNYRLLPYTQQEGALDLARAVRFVRKNADVYHIKEKDIVTLGFSAGGILSGEMSLNFDGKVNGKALDSDYIPDTLDKISANVSACGMVYSFYGWLNEASVDTEKLRLAKLPPTYFCYGTEDYLLSEFDKSAAALKEAGVPLEINILDGQPHGYGYGGGWIPDFTEWLDTVFGYDE